MAKISALEAFNVRLCEETGAGRGHKTTPEAIAAYYRLMASRAEECRALIKEEWSIRNAGGRFHSAFVTGMEAALDRATRS